MTFSELADLVAQNVQNAGGGIISRGTEQLSIRAVSRGSYRLRTDDNQPWSEITIGDFGLRHP